MLTSELCERVERLAEMLVLADINDLPALASLHTEFERLEIAVCADGFECVAKMAKASADLLESVILDEAKEPSAVLEDLNLVVANLQGVFRDGRPAETLSWPSSLKPIAGADKTAAADVELETDAEENPESKAVAADATGFEHDPTLLSEFVNEATEHLDAADTHLLDLESGAGEDNDDALNAVFRAFHTIKGVAGFLALGDIQRLAHEAENLLDKARKSEIELTGQAMDVTFDAVDMMKRLVANLSCSLENGAPAERVEGLNKLVDLIKDAASGNPAGRPEPQAVSDVDHVKPLGEILMDQGKVTPAALAEALEKQRTGEPPQKLGEILVQGGEAAAKDVAQALRVQNSRHVIETLKVDAGRLDLLIDMIGELVIAESMVSQSDELRASCSPDLARSMTQLDKITRELQEMGTGLRMVPIRPTFQKMARLVRDLAKKSGKQVHFVSTGEDTELDKSVVDKIGDPLIHMVRNAVDHGLEPNAEARRGAGKSPVGRVELRAFHKGGSIYVEIEDDGKGLDRDGIVAKARRRGLIREDENLSDHDVWNLVFEPGLSTAKKVTDVSGRGVGMDVVKRNIESLRGQIEIRSEEGKGSTFSIRLPLTLAIIDGMVVRIGRERYIIPTLSIVMSIRPEPGQVSTVVDKGEMLALQGRLIPLLRLARLFNIAGGANEFSSGIVMVVEEEGRRIGVLVDEILGQQQIVIKSLGEALQSLPGIAGGAIMPDGAVGLILDVSGIVRLANDDSSGAPCAHLTETERPAEAAGVNELAQLRSEYQ